MAASCVAVVAMKEHSVAKKKNMSGPDMIMIHFTGGKACITKKTKNYVGSAVDLQSITAFFFVLSATPIGSLPLSVDYFGFLQPNGL